MPFASVFNALFQYTLVEQCIAFVQNNQQAAVDAYGIQSPYGKLDYIADYHKGPVASPQFPSLTVAAGDATFNEESGQSVREYSVPIGLHLDLRYSDPDQVADWAYHYARLLDQIFSTVTNRGANLTDFTTAQNIVWPGGTAARQTVPFAGGTVLEFFIHSHHVGLLPKDTTDIPGMTIAVMTEFKLLEL